MRTTGTGVRAPPTLRSRDSTGKPVTVPAPPCPLYARRTAHGYTSAHATVNVRLPRVIPVKVRIAPQHGRTQEIRTNCLGPRHSLNRIRICCQGGRQHLRNCPWTKTCATLSDSLYGASDLHYTHPAPTRTKNPLGLDDACERGGRKGDAANLVWDKRRGRSRKKERRRV